MPPIQNPTLPADLLKGAAGNRALLTERRPTEYVPLIYALGRDGAVLDSGYVTVSAHGRLIYVAKNLTDQEMRVRLYLDGENHQVWDGNRWVFESRDRQAVLPPNGVYVLNTVFPLLDAPQVRVAWQATPAAPTTGGDFTLYAYGVRS